MHRHAKTSLVAKRFSADFRHITLTQLGSPDPLMIDGVGSISQDEFGVLRLKLFQQSPLNTRRIQKYHKEKSDGNISSAGACRLQAIDYTGGTWTCDYLKTKELLYMGSDGCTGIFSSEVGRLERSHGIPSCFQASSFEGIIPFEFDLPYNLGADGKRNSYPERLVKFTFGKMTKVEIQQCDGYTAIKISNKFELISERLIELLIQGLSIAIGRNLKFIWWEIIGEHFYHGLISEFDFELSRTSLRPPLDQHSGIHFLNFLKLYIEFGLKHNHNYFGYWEKLHASWASGLVVAALPLSVYIEGVVKEFYPTLMMADAALIDEINLTIEAVDNLIDMDSKIKERVRNRIRGIARGTITNGLRALAKQGYIGLNLVTSWQSVRHRSAHGDDFTQEDVIKIQKVVTGIYSCLHLFYELLHMKLEFSGYIVNYSKAGFPTDFRYAKKLNISQEID
jgi:hypothetical protein